MLLTRSRSVGQGALREPAARDRAPAARLPPLPPTTALKRCRKASVSGADSAGSSSMVSAIRHSRYALVTGVRKAGGSCGMVSAKVRETCGKI